MADHTDYLDAWWEENWVHLGASERRSGKLEYPYPVMLWDLDSTVSRTLRRRPMIEEIKAGAKTWEDYSLACHLDEPIIPNVTLMVALAQYQHIALSGRSGAALGLSQEWAEAHEVPLSAFLLRPAGDSTSNGEWKVECIDYLKARGVNLVCMFEDWQPVAEYIMAETGLQVVCLNPLDPEDSRQPYSANTPAISESL